LYHDSFEGTEYTTKFYTLVDQRYISGDCCYDFVKGYHNSNNPDNFTIIKQMQNGKLFGVGVIDNIQNHGVSITTKLFQDRDYLRKLSETAIRVKQAADLGQP